MTNMVAPEQISYRWRPIEPLSAADREIDLADVKPLYEAWHVAHRRLKQSSAESFRAFSDRLVRSLSIETGILERLYDLDRGTTEALVLHGFVEDLVARSSTNIEPSALVDILRDQEAAVRLVMDCVGSNRDLSKALIHELHAILTRHQFETDAVDQFGNRIKIRLIRGAYKQFPNNPVRDDGSVHEYCPPIHVESEMDNLLSWYDRYENEDPILRTAWLHHRFTQIHPYQDGNGRLARVISTLVLLKAGLLPIVVDRDLRRNYITVLEEADRGDLRPLVEQFATLEKHAILQALSVETEPPRVRSVSRDVIFSLASKLQRRHLTRDAQLRRVNDVAQTLRDQAYDIVSAALSTLNQTVEHVAATHVLTTVGGPDRGNEHWYRFDVVQSARSAEKWVNFTEPHFFIKGAIRVDELRLVFVVSLHHIGRELSGVMEATAFAWLESFDSSDDLTPSARHYVVCSLEPFAVTWNADAQDLAESFHRWLDSALAVAFKELSDRI